ncbi:MAG: hypothetical protein Q9227_009269 [Pyrenula ochraceoflavens]
MALAAYRHVLRSARIAFQGIIPSKPPPSPFPTKISSLAPHQKLNSSISQGDSTTLQASLTTARDKFAESRSLSPNSPEATAAIQHAEEVAKVLRHNLVQGQREAGGDPDKLRLRIHEDVERGDNDTVKMPNGQRVKVEGACS